MTGDVADFERVMRPANRMAPGKDRTRTEAGARAVYEFESGATCNLAKEFRERVYSGCIRRTGRLLTSQSGNVELGGWSYTGKAMYKLFVWGYWASSREESNLHDTRICS